MTLRYLKLCILMLTGAFVNSGAMEKPDQQVNLRFVSESKEDLVIVLNKMGVVGERLKSDFSRDVITNGGKIAVALNVSPTFFEFSKNTRIPFVTVAVNDQNKRVRASSLTLDLFFPEDKTPYFRLSMGGYPLASTVKSLEAVKNNKTIDIKIVLKDNLRQSILTVE